MLNIIQNTIGALDRRLGIVKKNLQMWLGFTKADIIGKELLPLAGSIDNSGDAIMELLNQNNYSATSDGVQTSSVRPRFTIATTTGSTYNLIITPNPNSTPTGTIKSKLYDGSSYVFTNYDFTSVKEFTFKSNGVVNFNLNGTNVFDTGEFSISVKEVAQFATDKSVKTNEAKLFTGKALSFDGVNDYIDFGSDINSNGTIWTTAIWLSDYTATTFAWILGDSTTRNIGLNNSVGGKIFFRDSSANYHDFNFSGYSVDLATPQRLVFSSNGTNISLYINGVFINAITPSTTELRVSRLMAGYSNSQYMVNGTVSDFQIYNAAWDSDDAVYDYANPNNLVFNNSASNIALSNLKGYYALSEGSGSIAYDSSGEGNSGNVYDGSTLGATYVNKQPTIPQLGMVDWAKSTPVSTEVTLIEAPNDLGKDVLGNSLRLRDGGFNLDGSGYGSVAISSELTAITNGTIQFWLKTSDTKFSVLNGQSSSEFIGKTDNGVWSFGNAGTITSYIGSDTASTQPLYNNAWNFYTFTGVNLSAWNEFYTSNLAGFDIDGIIDEVLIYSSVLSAKEIKNNYKIGLSKHS